MDSGQVWSNGANYPRGTQNVNLSLTQEGATIINNLSGKYWQYVKNGYGFWYTTAITGLTVALPTTSNQFCVWNTSTTALFCPVFFCVTYVSGTTLGGGFSWAILNPAGYNLATAAPITAFTNITPTNALIGAGPPNPPASVMRFSVANTLTAPTYQATLGWSVGGTGTFLTNTENKYVFDGSIAIGPGTAFVIGGTVASQAGVYIISLFGLELPLNQ